MPNYSDNEAIQIQRRRSSHRRALIHQDPDDSFDELYARRRPSSTYDYTQRSQSVGFDDRGRQPSRLVEEAVVQRRYNSVSDHGRSRSRYDSDSSLISPRTIPRRRKSSARRTSQNQVAIIQQAPRPCSPRCAESNHAARPKLAADSDDDTPYDSDEAREKAKKLRNKELLYAGLASATTIAAANNIYQSSKASKARRAEVRSGVLCESGARREKNKGVLMDLLSVGVAAVCVNNAVNGWKAMDRQRQEAGKHQERVEEKRERRKSIGLVRSGPGLGSRMGSVDWRGPASPRVSVR